MLLGCPRSDTREWHRTHRVGLMWKIFHPAKCFCSTALPALCLCAELGWPLSCPHSVYPLKRRPPGTHRCLVSGPSLKPRFLHVQSRRRMLIVSVARSFDSLSLFCCPQPGNSCTCRLPGARGRCRAPCTRDIYQICQCDGARLGMGQCLICPNPEDVPATGDISPTPNILMCSSLGPGGTIPSR